MPALAFSGPRVSEPQIGWPPTNRGDRAAAPTTLAFVEPTSVTVASPAPARTAAHVVGAAEALRHVLARELEVHAAGPHTRLPARGEEALDLPHHRVEAPRLDAAAGLDRVCVHRVAGPDDGMALLADRAQERRQQL